MARGKLAVLSTTTHIFWICSVQWSYGKVTHQWTQNSSKTSEACVIAEENTSKAEFVEKRASDNRENDTILHNFRQKQPGDWDSQVHIDYYPVIKRDGRAVNSETRERGRTVSHLKNQMIWILFLRLSWSSTACFRQQIKKILHIYIYNLRKLVIHFSVDWRVANTLCGLIWGRHVDRGDSTNSLSND